VLVSFFQQKHQYWQRQEYAPIFGVGSFRIMPSVLHLETSRFILRPPLKKDIPAIVKHLSQEVISQNTLQIPYPYTRKDALTWVTKNKQEILRGTSYSFAILSTKTNQMIGAIGLHLQTDHNRAEVGYWIAVPFWNQGVATEALVRIMKFGFDELGLNKIFATHLVENPSSGRVMMKAGMTREGKLPEHYKKGEVYKTILQYGITATQYKKMHTRNIKKTSKAVNK
jgi:ribosomal-protein-alanine N-acetyltransferase